MIIYFPEQDKFLSNNLQLSDIPCKDFHIINSEDEDQFYILLEDKFISAMNSELVFSKEKKLLFEFVEDNIFESTDCNLTIENNRLAILGKNHDTAFMLLCKNDDVFYNKIKLNIYAENPSSGNFSVDIPKLNIELEFEYFISIIDLRNRVFKKGFSLVTKNNEFFFDGITMINPIIWELNQWNFSIQTDDMIIGVCIESMTDKNNNVIVFNKKRFADPQIIDVIKQCNDVEILEELKNGLMDPEFIDKNGDTSLMLAIEYNLTNTALLLIQSKINLNHINNEIKLKT